MEDKRFKKGLFVGGQSPHPDPPRPLDTDSLTFCLGVTECQNAVILTLVRFAGRIPKICNNLQVCIYKKNLELTRSQMSSCVDPRCWYMTP